MNDLDLITNIAYKAGKEILAIYNQKNLKVLIKKDNTPLTEADQLSSNIICNDLLLLYPTIPIICEEGSFEDYNYDIFWCIDPLDGTKEFINRNGEFTINIALVEKGIPTLGVIYIPVKNEFYFSLKGEGAFFRKNNLINKLPKQLANKKKQFKFAVSRSHINAETQRFVSKFNAKMISAGSSLKLTMLANGVVDVYPRFGPTSIWDIAAGHAIINETGGKINTLDGDDLIYQSSQVINPNFIAFRTRDLNLF